MTLVDKSNYPKIVEIYNENGKKAAYEYIKKTYGIKRPDFVIKRIDERSGFRLDKESGKFIPQDSTTGEELFMSIDDLCRESPKKEPVTTAEPSDVTMEKLIHNLISDRLLELSRYVTLDASSRIITVDKTSMKNDGYTVKIH